MPKLKKQGVAIVAAAAPLLAQPTITAASEPKRKKALYPPGVSKTGSGKFQARIKLNGKRYDLGSNFNTVEEAAAAYAAAKRTGETERPSPKHNRAQRGTGTPHPLHTTIFCTLLNVAATLVSIGRSEGAESARGG